MTAISKNVYFDVLDDIVNKYNNTVHKTIKMKPIDITDDSYPEYNILIKKILNLRLVIMLEFQNTKTFFTSNWSEKVFIVSKIENTVPWTYAVSDLNGEEITGSFYEKELQKPSQKKFRIEKVLKRKGDKLYVKWKGYNNRFNSWMKLNFLDKIWMKFFWTKFFKWNFFEWSFNFFLNEDFLMKPFQMNFWNFLNEIFLNEIL